MVEIKECLECKHEFKCCGWVDVTISLHEAMRIMEHLDIHRSDFDSYFSINMRSPAEFNCIHIKLITIDFSGMEKKICVFYDPDKRICNVHEVKPRTCAEHICYETMEKLDPETQQEIIDNRKKESSKYINKYDEARIINKIIQKICNKERMQALKIIDRGKSFMYELENLTGEYLDD